MAEEMISRKDAEKAIDVARKRMTNGDVEGGWPAFMRDAICAIPAVQPTVLPDVAERFEKADWYWRTMDPDDCGDSPEEAVNRGMLGRFCVCEIASSYTGPTRYGFIAPVLDAESDDEEFVHFATQDEAIEAAKARATLAELKGRDDE